MKKIGFFIIFLGFLTGACSMTAREVRTGENYKEKPEVRGSKLLTGEIQGQFTSESGESMAGGMVFFFNDGQGPPPSNNKYWRIPDHVDDIDSGGRFFVVLPAGKYYLGAMKRVQELNRIGPPDDGDLFFIPMTEESEPMAWDIKDSERLDIGTISGVMRFSRSIVELSDGITAISGVIRDSDGHPVEGALVFAYIGNVVGKPLFVSDRTGTDGKYLIRMHEGGDYFLRVRGNYGGGPPVAGEIMGGLGTEEPLAVSVNTGEITTDIDINILKFPGRGPKAGQMGRSSAQPQMQNKTSGSKEKLDK